MPSPTLVVIVISFLPFLAALWMATGSAGVLYVALYAAAVCPGVLLGQKLIGPSRVPGTVAGAVLGYGATQIALWVPIALRIPSAASFIAAWLLVAWLQWTLARRLRGPVLVMSDFDHTDVRWLALTLLLIPVIMGPPYRNLGAADDTGTRYYRAYFTADFVWHTALAAELGRYDSPPRNPYMASSTLNYYWGYFLLPSVVARETPPPLGDVQQALKANAMASGLLFVGMLFLFVRTAVPSARVAATAVALAVLAASAEGAFVLQQLWRAGGSLAPLLDTNIDAITAWQFEGLRIDGLPRGLWYNPQHTFSCAAGLVGLTIAALAGARASNGAIWTAGAALGLSTCFNPFVGALFSAVYGLSTILDAGRRESGVRLVVRHAQAAVPVLAGLAWVLMNAVAEGAGAAVSFGLLGNARHSPVTSLALSVGPVLIPALLGLWPWRGLPGHPARVAAIGTIVALLVMHLVTLSESSWVGFRTGQILLLMVPVLVARLLWAVGRQRFLWGALIAGLILLAGLPTTLIDVYNAQDITNQREGPTFRWTLTVTPAQQAAFAWIKQNLPSNATVQMEPMVRGREHWSLIPSFAERRMMAGLPISLLPQPEYTEASEEVRRLFQTSDVHEAWQLARKRRIRYLYVDPDDRAAYPEGIAKFSTSPNFKAVYDRDGITLYQVR